MFVSQVRGPSEETERGELHPVPPSAGGGGRLQEQVLGPGVRPGGEPGVPRVQGPRVGTRVPVPRRARHVVSRQLTSYLYLSTVLISARTVGPDCSRVRFAGEVATCLLLVRILINSLFQISTDAAPDKKSCSGASC